jgi:dihydrofolate reductase
MRLISAVSLNGVIGKNNTLPWSLSEDLKFFKSKTVNNIIVMGKNTYDSIGSLPKRKSIVLSSKKYNDTENVFFTNFTNFPTKLIEVNRGEDVYVIGGSQIYSLFLHGYFIDEMYITHVHKEVEGDSYFPYYEIIKNLKGEIIMSGEDFHIKHYKDVSNVEFE